MIPIGRGQRELIIGDRKTGKTAIAIDTIINQKGENVVCVYVAIGQKESTVAGRRESAEARRDGLHHRRRVVGLDRGAAAVHRTLRRLRDGRVLHVERAATRCASMTILSKQAAAYRQLSLLLRRPPGREAFPGDVFYLHSRLLERAVKLSEDQGSQRPRRLAHRPADHRDPGRRSLRLHPDQRHLHHRRPDLPRPDLFFAGVRPAINVGISVSRVGGNAQTKAMKKIAGSLRLVLAPYRELEAFAQLGTELDKATQKQLDRGARLVELLKQPQYQPMPVESRW